MGLFDWLKPKIRTHGPTPGGLYGELPKGGRWVGEADPAGDPEDFVPGSEAYVLISRNGDGTSNFASTPQLIQPATWQGSVLFSDYPMAEIPMPLRFGSTREVEARS